MTPYLRKLIEDTLYIRATHILRRRISRQELSYFFVKNTHVSEKLYNKFLSDLDDLIKKYLEEIK